MRYSLFFRYLGQVKGPSKDRRGYEVVSGAFYRFFRKALQTVPKKLSTIFRVADPPRHQVTLLLRISSASLSW